MHSQFPSEVRPLGLAEVDNVLDYHCPSVGSDIGSRIGRAIIHHKNTMTG